MAPHSSLVASSLLPRNNLFGTSIEPPIFLQAGGSTEVEARLEWGFIKVRERFLRVNSCLIELSWLTIAISLGIFKLVRSLTKPYSTMPRGIPNHNPFFVWQNRKLIRLFPEDVAFLRIDENYTKIFINDGDTFTIRSTMSSALKKLPEDLFLRVHKKYAVSILYIESIANDHLIIGTYPIPIGRQFKQSLLWRLNIIE